MAAARVPGACATSRSPSTQNGEEYYFATWTGISGDRFYRNAPGADFTTFTDEWVNANIRSKGPLGKLYPYPCCIHEGDTPSFLGSDRQRAGERHEPGVRRLGRPLRLAPAVRRDAAVLDAGRRLLSRATTTRATRCSASTGRPTRPTRPRSGAGGRRSSTTSRRAWTGRSRTPAEANHNPRVVVNGARGHGAARDRRAGRHAGDARRGRHDRPRRPRADLHRGSSTRRRAPGFPGSRCFVRQRRPRPPPARAASPRRRPADRAQPPAALVVEHADGPRATVVPKVARHRARHPRRRRQRHAEPHLLPARSPRRCRSVTVTRSS